MVDEFDRAAELEQMQRDIALHNQAQKNRKKPASLTTCMDCWYDIEPERQALGGALRCAECQGYHLQEQHLKGF